MQRATSTPPRSGQGVLDDVAAQRKAAAAERKAFAWRAAGRALPHASVAQYSATARVPVLQIEVGNLIVYGTPTTSASTPATG